MVNGTYGAPQFICCGLSTVDMQLEACQVPLHLEHVTPFECTTSTAGGSAPQTALALESLQLSQLGNGNNVAVLTAVGRDEHADTLRTRLARRGINTAGVVTVDEVYPTALAILPLYVDGRRGCFFTLGANLVATPENLLRAAEDANLVPAQLTASASSPNTLMGQRNNIERLGAFHFGYPHLMPKLQNENLSRLFNSVRSRAPSVLLSLHVNGASSSEATQAVLLPSLSHVAFIHANLEEAATLTGVLYSSPSSSISTSTRSPVAVGN